MKVKKYDIVIAIDPDVGASGFASYNQKGKRLTVGSLPFAQLLDVLRMTKQTCEQKDLQMLVVVEAGWLESKSNHHGYHGRVAEKIAKNVGGNHQTGKLIKEMCLHYKIECRLQKPFKLIWGKDRHSKISSKEFKMLTGYNGRTNQDGRDAGLICWQWKDTIIQPKADE